MIGLRVSPLPWRARHDGDEVQIGDASGEFVAMTLGADADVATSCDYDNALMIAHAVSNYDKLRNTLAELIEFMAGCDVEHPAFDDAKRVMDEIRNAEDEVRRLSRE